ncbi:MAG: hypothetical protein GXC72_07750 [Chitinophagaceae bacterium]|nr:hypothetical protein [Chitinophagaceae bacterium]
MKPKEIIDFNKSIIHTIMLDPDKAYEFFKKVWVKLSFTEKNACRPFITKFCEQRAGDESLHPQRAENFEETRICSQMILDYLNEEKNGVLHYGTIKLQPGTKPKDIAFIFSLLKDLEYIKTSKEEMAQILIQVFDIRGITENTMKQYLSQKGDLKMAKNKFYGRLQSFPVK